MKDPTHLEVMNRDFPSAIFYKNIYEAERLQNEFGFFVMLQHAGWLHAPATGNRKDIWDMLEKQRSIWIMWPTREDLYNFPKQIHSRLYIIQEKCWFPYLCLSTLGISLLLGNHTDYIFQKNKKNNKKTPVHGLLLEEWAEMTPEVGKWSRKRK